MTGDTDEERALISIFKSCGWGFNGGTFLGYSLTFRRNGMYIFLRFNDDSFEIIDTHNDKIYSGFLGDPECISKLKIELSKLDFGSFLL